VWPRTARKFISLCGVRFLHWFGPVEAKRSKADQHNQKHVLTLRLFGRFAPHNFGVNQSGHL
jgi:hypothetical protein